MKAIYDKISVFCFILTLVILMSFFTNPDRMEASISYSVLFRYSVIIFAGIFIFTAVERLPLRSPLILYMISSILITSETIVMECVVFRWVPVSFLNCFFLTVWVFSVAGIITCFFVRKSKAEAEIMNQRIQEWSDI